MLDAKPLLLQAQSWAIMAQLTAALRFHSDVRYQYMVNHTYTDWKVQPDWLHEIFNQFMPTKLTTNNVFIHINT